MSWTYGSGKPSMAGMRIRHLGAFETSAIGIGCMGFSQGYGAASEEESTRAIGAALEAGITLFDTAMSYGEGGNERLVGAALGRRGQVATKVGIVRGTDGVRLDAAPERIRGYCEASLRRLGRDHIDLYYLHRVDPAYPVEDQVGALHRLVDAGLVRHLGVSEVTAEQLRRAHATAPIAAVQLEWSLAWRAPERDILPVARELGVGVVAYSPLGRGLLTAHPGSTDPAGSSFRSGDPRFAGPALDANTAQARTLASLAARSGVEPAQLALAWLLAQGEDVVAIPGSRHAERVRSNAAAGSLDLDAATLDALAGLAFVGDRQSFAVPVTSRG
jgi:aryl-alcohol dehydrogenase-like predicted oxidoreductase